MILFSRSIAWVMLVVCVWVSTAQAVVINEFMADNGGSVRDPQGDADDWIELYNPAAAAVNVSDWYLTDDLAQSRTWRIPSGTVIPGRGFLVIWADNDEGASGLHASFSLRAGGEEIGLYGADGSTLMDSVIFAEQIRDQSYARYPDGGPTWQFVDQPSPGTSNGAGVLGIVGPVEFSLERGFYDAPMTVTLSTETEGAEIWYTTDANLPHAVDPETGEAYGQRFDHPLTIGQTTCLRAVAVKTDWQASDVTTHTYLFRHDVLRQSNRPTGFPVQWGSNRVDYAMDPRVVDDPAYSSLAEDLKAIPSVCIVLPNADFFGTQTGIYANARQSHDPDQGQDWERAASMEWIDPQADETLGVNAALRVYGGDASRSPSVAKHGLRLLFKSDYGPSKLDFPVFPGSPVEEFDTLFLRAIWSDSWIAQAEMDVETATYLRNAYCMQTMRDMGHLAPYHRHVHLYINGLYWGLYELHERPDAEVMADTLDRDPDDFDILRPGDDKSDPMDVVAGDALAWETLFDLAERVQSDPSRMPELQARIDLENLIDYMLMVCYTGSRDAPTYLGDNRHPHNFYALASRTAPGLFSFLPWDMTWVLEDSEENRVTELGGRENPGALFQVLGQDEGFRLRVADRIQKHFHADGLLSPGPAGERFQALADTIAGAMVAESARWGDTQRSVPLSRDMEWATEIHRIINDYMSVRTETVVDQLREAGWYPALAAPVYAVNGILQHGGRIDREAPITLTQPDPLGTIYYRLDGSDPRMVDGRISPEALAFGEPILLDKSTRITARTHNGSWSALSEAVFAVGPLSENLRITEIMMNPVDPNAEFIELANLGNVSINLVMTAFTRGIDYRFEDCVLDVGEHAVLVRNQAAFTATHGPNIRILGEYQGSLDNDGERMDLVDGTGALLLSLTYQDRWYDLADGQGFSLVLRDETRIHTDQELSDPESWRPSTYAGGSPGTTDPALLPQPGAVVINEVLANSASGSPDWIELVNTTDQAIPLGGWWLSDDGDDPFKYRIPGNVVLEAGGYVVFYQDSHFDFGLAADGETVVLQAGIGGNLAGYRQVESFGASAANVSLGRHVKSTGASNFVAMTAMTPGAENSYPRVGPLIISEIMYHPAGDAGAEYLELHNTGSLAIALYDATSRQGWRLTDEGDPGIAFVFQATDTILLEAGARLILTRSRTAFESLYTPPAQVQILEWGLGALGNGGDRIQLDRPGETDADGDGSWIRVDRVVYSDGSHPAGSDPWPMEADGQGMALERVSPDVYGNDPVHWMAAPPTPGY
jgi:hypothetical protein